MILERGGTFRKIVDQGSHRGVSHWGTWTGCFQIRGIIH